MSEQTVAPIVATDWLLEQLVRTVNLHPKSSFDITLHVAGGVLTGRLIGFHTYYVGLGKLMEQLLGGGEAGQGVAKSYAEYAEKELARFTTDVNYQNSVRFIHVGNARLVFGITTTPPPPQDGFLWRGRISEVTGFAIGSLGPPQGSPPPMPSSMPAPWVPPSRPPGRK